LKKREGKKIIIKINERINLSVFGKNTTKSQLGIYCNSNQNVDGISFGSLTLPRILIG